MFRRFRAFGMAVVLLLGFVVAACGDNNAPNAATNNVPATDTPGIPNVKIGIDSTLAKTFPATTSIFIDLGTKSDSNSVKNWQRMLTYLKNVPQIGDATKQIDQVSGSVITYDADIQPWLGNEAAFGITDLKSLSDSVSGLLGPLMGGANATGNTSASTGDLSVLFEASVKDKAKAEAFVAKLINLSAMANQGQPLPVQTAPYNGEQISTITITPGLPSLAYSVTADRLILGTEKTVKAAIDQKSNGLDTNAQYQKVAKKLPADFLGFFYLDYQQITKLLLDNPMIKKSLASTSPSCLATLQTIGGYGSVATAVDEGFRFDSYASYGTLTDAQKADLQNTKNTPNKIAANLPDNTLFSYSGFNLSNSYDQIMKSMTNSACTPTSTGSQSVSIQDTITKAEQQSGLNIKDDLTSWITDEYAVIATPAKGNPSQGGTPVGGTIIAKVSDKTLAQQKLDKIANAIATKAQPPVTFSDKTINGAKFKSGDIKSSDTSSTMQPISLNLGIVGDYAIIGLTDDATSSAVDAANGKATLNNSVNFQKATGGVYKPFSGLVFFDVQGIIQTVLNALPADQKAQAQSVTSQLTQIKAGAASFANDGTDGAYISFYLYFPTK